MEHVSKTEHYLRVKKPLLERQRRARINKCLDAMKQIIAELQNDDSILRMDKAEMLEATIDHLRQTSKQTKHQQPVDSFRNGYINAANEVSRVLASVQRPSAELGKAVMTHLGSRFVQLQKVYEDQREIASQVKKYTPLTVDISLAPLSPASSGYHSDNNSPGSLTSSITEQPSVSELWRPW